MLIKNLTNNTVSLSFLWCPLLSQVPYSFMPYRPALIPEHGFMDIIKAATVKEKKIMMEDDPLRLPIFCIRLQAFILRFVLIVLAPFQKDCL